MTASIFNSLCAQLHVEPDGNGECWIDCPQCGKGAKHFSFNEHAGHCFACDYSGSLRAIAELLNIRSETRATVPLRAHRKPVTPRDWQKRPGLWLERSCEAFDRLPAWQSYKPLSLDSIARHRLGVGVLPSSRCRHRRLILPVFDDGKVVAFHGRAFLPSDTDAKWLTAGGGNKKILFLTSELRSGCTLILVENYVDAILVTQTAPDVVCGALGGASWQDAWTQQIAVSRPAHVLVWLDNDLIGCPNRETYCALLADWRALHLTAVRPPEPHGPKIANDLLAAGVRVSLYDWPRGTPAKADVGWALMQGRNV